MGNVVVILAVIEMTSITRAGTTAQALGKIRPAFPHWGNGTTTGGNASQVTDGVAAVVLMRRSKAKELGITILGRYVTTAVAGKYFSRNHRLELYKFRVHQVWPHGSWVLVPLLPFRKFSARQESQRRTSTYSR